MLERRGQEYPTLYPEEVQSGSVAALREERDRYNAWSSLVTEFDFARKAHAEAFGYARADTRTFDPIADFDIHPYYAKHDRRGKEQFYQDVKAGIKKLWKEKKLTTVGAKSRMRKLQKVTGIERTQDLNVKDWDEDEDED